MLCAEARWVRPLVNLQQVTDETGAGDSFAATFAYAYELSNGNLVEAAHLALEVRGYIPNLVVLRRVDGTLRNTHTGCSIDTDSRGGGVPADEHSVGASAFDSEEQVELSNY